MDKRKPSQIKIMLVDDHDLVRQSWKLMLDKDDRFSVIAQYKNAAEAIERAQSLHPDVILMDVNMSPITGFEATQKILELVPAARIIGISINTNKHYVSRMLSADAKGYVTKTSPFEELKTAISKVFNGEKYICEEILRKTQ